MPLSRRLVAVVAIASVAIACGGTTVVDGDTTIRTHLVSSGPCEWARIGGYWQTPGGACTIPPTLVGPGAPIQWTNRTTGSRGWLVSSGRCGRGWAVFGDGCACEWSFEGDVEVAAGSNHIEVAADGHRGAIDVSRPAGAMLSGTVSPPLPEGAEIVASGAGGATFRGVTGPEGDFHLCLPAGTYVLRPQRICRSFLPPDRSVTVENVALGGHDFTASGPGDTPGAAHVVSVVPASGTTNVALDAVVTVAFTEPMDPGTLRSGGLRLTDSGTPVSGTVDVDAAVATFRPAAPLRHDTVYNVELDGILDCAGVALWSPPYPTWFRTEPPPDTMPPQVASMYPRAGATGVDPAILPQVVFDEPMDAATLDGALTLHDSSGGSIAASISISSDGRTATLSPIASLGLEMRYTARVSAAARDVAGNPLASPHESAFETIGSGIGTWRSMSQAGAPEPRALASAVWTGSEMIVWGGINASGPLATGGRYDPRTDTWRSISSVGAPSARSSHVAVWTGSEMIVWGGHTGLPWGELADGASYDPQRDAWTPLAPPTWVEPLVPLGVWTGSVLVLPGDSPYWGRVAPKARYDPVVGSWSKLAGGGSGRRLATAVWTGTSVIVIGGEQGTCSARTTAYDPVADAWSIFRDAPEPRCDHVAVWTGSRVIVWGGSDGSVPLEQGAALDASRPLWLDPWSRIATAGAPASRSGARAAWTGARMIAWGGEDSRDVHRTGGLYDPAADAWQTTALAGAPSRRAGHVAVWTGTELVVWGGRSRDGLVGDGARYLPTHEFRAGSIVAP